MRLSEPPKKLNEDRPIHPYYQQQKRRPMTLVSGGVRFRQIFAGVPWEGRQTTVGLSTTAIFSVFDGYFFVNFRDEAKAVLA